MVSLDESLFFFINGLAGRSEGVDWFMKLVVGEQFIPVAIVMVLLAMWFLGKDAQSRERNQRAVWCALIGAGFACAIVWICNRFFEPLRPFDIYGVYPAGQVHLLFYQPTDPSFPSNTAAVGFAFAMGAWFGNRKAGYLLLCLAILWSFARVYVGVHFPLDIVGGAALGMLASFAALGVLRIAEPLPTWILKGLRRIYLA